MSALTKKQRRHFVEGLKPILPNRAKHLVTKEHGTSPVQSTNNSASVDSSDKLTLPPLFKSDK